MLLDAHGLLRLMALGLELPEDTLVNMHKWNGGNESSSSYLEISHLAHF